MYGQKVHIVSDESAFSSDIAVWCERTGNTLISLENNGTEISVLVEKHPAEKQSVQLPNDKTFVLFSGGLDKTIAAFIMANAAASMGRKECVRAMLKNTTQEKKEAFRLVVFE